MISEFIFYEDNASKEEKSLYINLKVKIRDMLREDFTRTVVSEILLDLRKDVSGSAQERLFSLFKDLDLHKESYAKLESWRWEHISKGIEELTRMEVSDSYDFITKFINDKRSTIRKQAEIGVVTLRNEGIKYFLDTTRHRISEWQQLKLMEVLSNKTEFVPPSFMAWLTSTNKFAVLFALRLIKYYDQNDARASIIELVKHSDNQIKQEALDCIKAFYIVEALPTLKKVFWSCSTDVKISILGTVGELGTPKDMPFLKSIKNKERNYSVTSKALSAINAITPESILPTQGITDIGHVEIPEDLVAEELAVQIPALQEKEIGAESKVVAEEPPIQAVKSQNEKILEQNEAGTEATAAQETAVPETREILPVEDDVGISQEPTSVNATKVLSEKDTMNVWDEEHISSKDSLPVINEIKEQYLNNYEETMTTPVLNIEVVFEEVLSKYMPKEVTTKSQDINEIEVISIHLDFLPIVVADDAEVGMATIALEDFVVHYEILHPVPAPIEEEEIVAIQDLGIDYTETTFVPIAEETKSVEDIQVTFEEVVPVATTKTSENDGTCESELLDIEVVFSNCQPPSHIQRKGISTFLDLEIDATEVEIACSPINEMEVIFERVHDDTENEDQELPLWLLNEIARDNSEVEQAETPKMEGPEWESKESQMKDKILSYFDDLPMPEELQSDIAESVRLLDDIALFGDEREIPLLQELIKKEDKIATRERIDALMKRFMGTNAYGAINIGTKPYSVFEELFRNCDTASKMILLDEIVAIGDKKEIHFLKKLVNDTNKDIRIKAKAILRQLEEKFAEDTTRKEEDDTAEYEHLLNTMELMPPKKSEIFEIDFELTPEENNAENEAAKKTGWFASFIHKFIKIKTDR